MNVTLRKLYVVKSLAWCAQIAVFNAKFILGDIRVEQGGLRGGSAQEGIEAPKGKAADVVNSA